MLSHSTVSRRNFSVLYRYEGIIVCVIRAEFKSTNTGWKKRHVVCSCLYAMFQKFLNNSSSLNKAFDELLMSLMEIMTVMVFGYGLILISIDFCHFISQFNP